MQFKDALILGVALCLIALMVVVGPETVTRTLQDRLASKPPPAEVSLQISEQRVHDAVAAVAEEEVRARVDRFASMGSRVVGYRGCDEAYRYIREEFERTGLERVGTEVFRVTVPVDKGAHLEVVETGEVMPLYGLWPNHVRTSTTPSAGLLGNLLYGGRGDFASFDGKRVESSIVLLDFDCGQNYVNPRMLGAQAVLFFDRGAVTSGQAADKFLKVPADVPRFWIEKEDAERLLALIEGASGSRDDPIAPEVLVRGRMEWEEVDAQNVYGYLPGASSIERRASSESRSSSGGGAPPLVVLEAYYDATSVVPALAPGAENACGIVALLHAARALKEYGSKYPVLFLATSAHFQGLSGVNDFLYRHSRTSDYFRKRIPEEERIDFKLFIGLDLSSRSSSVASFFTGTFYNPNWATDNYQKSLLAPYARKFTGYAEKLWPGEDRYVDAVAPPKRTWKNFMPVRLGLDSEAVGFMGMAGMSLVTPNATRERVDTPSDELEYVNVRGLTRQIQTVVGLLLKAANDPEFFETTKLMLRDKGHSLSGEVVWFDRNVHFAVPKAPVPRALVTYQQPGPNSVGGVRTLMITR